ncbi:hypothetical protein CspHIS471_0705220 [Cutaneotrichosporon sp. HIS471]|nr:hypothetical protein CspHIS471_0705220 [Cutaneotrichosporon sp. HIS471]
MRRVALLLLLLHVASAQYGYGPYPAPTTTTTTGTGTASKPMATAEAAGSNEGNEYGFKITPKSAVVAHVVCGALATMLLIPVGIMAARAPRAFTSKRWWFPLHAGTQVLAAVFVLAAFGIAWGRFVFHPVNTPHRKAAVSFFSIIFVQAFLGISVHFLRGESKSGRGILNYIHWAFGLCVVGVGWAVAWLGLTNEWQYRGHGKPSYGYRVAWGVIIGFWILVYAVGLTLLPRQLKRERTEADRVAAGHETETDVAPLHAPGRKSG